MILSFWLICIRLSFFSFLDVLMYSSERKRGAGERARGGGGARPADSSPSGDPESDLSHRAPGRPCKALYRERVTLPELRGTVSEAEVCQHPDGRGGLGGSEMASSLLGHLTEALSEQGGLVLALPTEMSAAPPCGQK